MKAAIVRKASLEPRWDAEHYLGDEQVLNGTHINKAEKRLRDAQKALRLANRQQRDEIRRIQRYVTKGKVVPFSIHGNTTTDEIIQ